MLMVTMVMKMPFSSLWLALGEYQWTRNDITDLLTKDIGGPNHYEPINLDLVLFCFDVFSSDCAKLDVCSSLDSTGVNLGN